MNRVKRKIRAKELVRDLRNGMSDRQLMEKYALSAEQLVAQKSNKIKAAEIAKKDWLRFSLHCLSVQRTESEENTIIRRFSIWKNNSRPAAPSIRLLGFAGNLLVIGEIAWATIDSRRRNYG